VISVYTHILRLSTAPENKFSDKIDRSLAQIDSGNVVTRTIAELEETERE
jgi:hypothetical protein